MTAAPHPYRHDDRPAKAVVRYWPVPGQLAASLAFLAILVGLTAWATTRVLRTVSHRLSCTRDSERIVTCTFYEERLLHEPKALWFVDRIAGNLSNPSKHVPGDTQSVSVMMHNEAVGDDTLRFGSLPITDAAMADRLVEFLDRRDEQSLDETEGEPGLLLTVSPIFFACCCLLSLARLPRPIVFTVDYERGTLAARFGSLFVVHTTDLPLAEIERVEVTVSTIDTRRLQIVKKDGAIEIFDEKHRPGLHHHHAADLLWTQIRAARRDLV